MKLLEITPQDWEDWEDLATWADEHLEAEKWIMLSHNAILMWEQDVEDQLPVWLLEKVNLSIFINNGEPGKLAEGL